MADSTAEINELFNNHSPKSHAQSVYVELEAGREYEFATPIVITAGALRRNFRLLCEGKGALLSYTGGIGKGPAVTLSSSAADLSAVYSELRNLSIWAPNGADCLLRLAQGSFCTLSNAELRGFPANIKTGVGLQIDNQQSLLLQQLHVRGCEFGLSCGRIANVINWQSGKVSDCGVGAFIDSSTGSINCVDFSKCDNAIIFDKCSQWNIHAYTEEIASTVYVVRNSLHLSFSGLVNGRGEYGFDVTNSKSIDIGNIESRMDMPRLVKRDANSTVTVSPLALPMRPRMPTTLETVS